MMSILFKISKLVAFI